MWARVAREIAGAFERFGSPLEAVAALDTPLATLHLYAQPADPGFLDAQRGYADAHPWFEVEHLDAASHFQVLEVPDAVGDGACALALVPAPRRNRYPQGCRSRIAKCRRPGGA